MGDSFYYLLGRWGRTHVVPRLGKYVGLTESRARQVDMHYERHAGKTLFFGKLAFSLEVPMIISAGMVRYPYVRFIVFMTLAALPKTLGLMLLGYFFGFSFESARHDLAYATHISLVALLVLACVIVVVRVSRRQLAVRTSKSHKD
jgi:membrane protein DedA with SNARE-associated domain